jgi:hypothetical protein
MAASPLLGLEEREMETAETVSGVQATRSRERSK